MNRIAHFTHLKNQLNKLLVKIGEGINRIILLCYSLKTHGMRSEHAREYSKHNLNSNRVSE